MYHSKTRNIVPQFLLSIHTNFAPDVKCVSRVCKGFFEHRIPHCAKNVYRITSDWFLVVKALLKKNLLIKHLRSKYNLQIVI